MLFYQITGDKWEVIVFIILRFLCHLAHLLGIFILDLCIVIDEILIDGVLAELLSLLLELLELLDMG